MDWHSRSGKEIINSIDLQCQSPNILMCLFAMDSLNDAMSSKILSEAMVDDIKRAAFKNMLNGNMRPGDGEAIDNIPQTKILKFTKCCGLCWHQDIQANS